MRYILPILLITLSFAAAAAGNKETAQEKPWTDEYQYGDKEKPDQEKEFQIAPKE